VVGARLLNIGLGLWLFISGFLWTHSPGERYDAWVVGIAVVTGALAAIEGATWGRHFNALCGLWLLVSAFFLSTPGGPTFWNHLILGVLIGSVGLMPNLRSFARRTPVSP
jgi:hypothetical protein